MLGAGATSSSSEDKQMFLELMVAQLRYQDPMNPTDSSAFLAQTAQFNALEQMTKVAEASATGLSMQMAFGASGLVGKDVTYLTSEGTSATGQVSGVTFSSDGPLLDIGGTSIPLAQIQSVVQAAAAAAPTAPAPTTQASASDD
nr:flagellar hook capping FlgD N-terminal domain-containing protein [Nocardioides daedukensis]